ncbi:hypothetical protein [Ferribacterium limneticum]|uniref:hypothetical protein n=1 Tax=Ferribacterium limneticum TaxID=76259 RepID=UPI001CF85E7E|nr:hypothetical protein [Ferribacterium limneticum]UCV26797.1 hypothetical protein KI617_10790 [Ferribacterium limneticum]UCV30714.1 hypothetical protein KI608_10790 [Ferribacterium limneticum]
MRLAKAASYFDRTICQDAYGSATFKAQFGLYDDATRDGLGTVRRILSTAPELVMPARHAIVVEGVTWLIGDKHQDFFGALAIRHKYVLHKAEGLANLRSFAECIAGTGGSQAYAAPVWIKTNKQVEISSDLFNTFEVILGQGEAVGVPSVIELNSKFFLVHSTYPTEAGFLAASSVELPSPRSTITSISRTYVPNTDTWTEAPVSVTGLHMRWQEHFKYFAQYSTDYEAGDMQVLVTKTDVASVKAGDRFVVGGQTYSVVVAYDETPIWSCHVRPV